MENGRGEGVARCQKLYSLLKVCYEHPDFDPIENVKLFRIAMMQNIDYT
jgi:hypothetical protein